MNYEKRVTQITVAPEGKPSYDELAFSVSITTEGAGEYVKVEGGFDGGGISIDPEAWPMLKESIEEMLAGCREGL